MTGMKSFHRFVLAGAVALSLAACGGGDNGTNEPATITREAFLTLGQEVPTPTAPPAANAIGGTMTVTLATATDKVSGTLILTGDFARVTGGAHIHAGNVGTSGAPDIPLQNDGNGRWSVPATAPSLTSAQEERFKAGGYYVNIHTDLNPDGEIRGQLIGFAGNIQPVLSGNCAVGGCHVIGGTAPMSLAPGASIANLVDRPASLGGTRVIPFDAANSVLYKKISGTSAGPQMPLGRSPLAANAQNLIKVWIDMGAKDN